MSTTCDESGNALAEIAFGRKAGKTKLPGVSADTPRDNVEDLSISRGRNLGPRSDELGQIECTIAKLFSTNDLGDQTHGEGRFGVEGTAREEERARDAFADGIDDEANTGFGVDEPEFRCRNGERRFRRGHSNVGRKSQFQSATDDVALNGDDDRYRPAPQRGEVGFIGDEILGSAARCFDQVITRTKVWWRGRNDDDPGTGGRFGDELLDAVDGRTTEHVASIASN